MIENGMKWIRFRILLKWEEEYYFLTENKAYQIIGADHIFISEIIKIKKEHVMWGMYIVFLIFSLPVYLYLSSIFKANINNTLYIVLFTLNILIYFLIFNNYINQEKIDNLIIKEIEKNNLEQDNSDTLQRVLYGMNFFKIALFVTSVLICGMLYIPFEEGTTVNSLFYELAFLDIISLMLLLCRNR